MSFEATRWAWDQDDLPSHPKYLLLALADYADDAGKCWPSQSALAKKMGLGPSSTRSIRGWTKILEDHGLISYTVRKRPGTKEKRSHLYQIHYKKVGAESPHVGAEDPHPPDAQPQEPTNEPTTEPITLLTPSPDGEDGKTPVASDLRSEHAQDDRDLRLLVRQIRDAQTVDDHDAASEIFLEAFADIHGDHGVPGDLYWNKGFYERLDQLVRAEGADYGIAKWLGIFTNTYEATA